MRHRTWRPQKNYYRDMGFSLKFIHIFDIICVFARGGEE
jgi:hypothetical protein